MGSDGACGSCCASRSAIIGVKATGAYGFAVALAPLIGVLYVAWRGHLKHDDGPEALVE